MLDVKLNKLETLLDRCTFSVYHFGVRVLPTTLARSKPSRSVKRQRKCKRCHFCRLLFEHHWLKQARNKKPPKALAFSCNMMRQPSTHPFWLGCSIISLQSPKFEAWLAFEVVSHLFRQLNDKVASSIPAAPSTEVGTFPLGSMWCHWFFGVVVGSFFWTTGHANSFLLLWLSST